MCYEKLFGEFRLHFFKNWQKQENITIIFLFVCTFKQKLSFALLRIVKSNRS